MNDSKRKVLTLSCIICSVLLVTMVFFGSFGVKKTYSLSNGSYTCHNGGTNPGGGATCYYCSSGSLNSNLQCVVNGQTLTVGTASEADEKRQQGYTCNLQNGLYYVCTKADSYTSPRTYTASISCDSGYESSGGTCVKINEQPNGNDQSNCSGYVDSNGNCQNLCPSVTGRKTTGCDGSTMTELSSSPVGDFWCDSHYYKRTSIESCYTSSGQKTNYVTWKTSSEINKDNCHVDEECLLANTVPGTWQWNSSASVCVCDTSKPSTSVKACYLCDDKLIWTDKPSNECSVNKLPESKCNSSEGDKKVVLTFVGDTTETRECLIKSGDTTCNAGIAPGPQNGTDSTKEFTGWGNQGCTTGSYGAYYSFTAASASHTYYACYTTKQTGTTIENSKCQFSGPFTVTRDLDYKNDTKTCKYVNITYNSSQTETNSGTAQSCCKSNGYTWVGSNYASGYEYCIVSCVDGVGVPIKDIPTTNNPTPSNPGTSTSTYNCYLCDSGYKWANGKPDDSCKVETSITSQANCKASSNNNVANNPQTSDILITIVWMIGLSMIGYSLWYYQNVKAD